MVVAILIPARNEAGALGQVLTEIPDGVHRQLVVVDNGSTDGTAQVAEELGAQVVSEPVPGYGRACLAGLRALDPEIDTVVFMDADHADYPEELSVLLAPIAQGRADLVIGSRIAQAEPGSLTLPQRIGNRLACWLIHRLYGFRYTDLGPFRAIRRRALERLDMRDQAFGWTVEMQVKALLHRLRVVEMPVRYRRRTGWSKISGTLQGVVRAGAAIVSTILRLKREEARMRAASRAALREAAQRRFAGPAPQAAERQGAPLGAGAAAARLIIFLKEPVPGRVKTRMGAELDDQAAAELSRAFAELTLERLKPFQEQALVYVDPPEALARVQTWIGQAWTLRAQQGATLGERLIGATQEAFADGAKRVVVIGTDSPWLQPRDLADAFAALRRRDVVIGAVEDGGYYLIGLARPAAALFDGIAWSSPRVYAQTLAKADALGASVQELPAGYDLDYVRDVQRFIEAERAGGGPIPPQVEAIAARLEGQTATV